MKLRVQHREPPPKPPHYKTQPLPTPATLPITLGQNTNKYIERLMQPYTETPRRRTRHTGNENQPLDVMFTNHSYQGPNETIHAI